MNCFLGVVRGVGVHLCQIFQNTQEYFIIASMETTVIMTIIIIHNLIIKIRFIALIIHITSQAVSPNIGLEEVDGQGRQRWKELFALEPIWVAASSWKRWMGWWGSERWRGGGRGRRRRTWQGWWPQTESSVGASEVSATGTFFTFSDSKHPRPLLLLNLIFVGSLR